MIEKRKEHYSKKGTYAGYDRNHKERDALDYYSTPTEEVMNILKTLNIDFTNQTILEPSAGGGHMLTAIKEYAPSANIIATDIKEREKIKTDLNILYGKQYDFFSDEYPYTENIDWIIMNPPYSVIEPFVMKALSIANKGIIMLGRLQFLEGQSRYENILKEIPPNETYVYVDRIACFKNGDTTQKMSSAQAYAWFIWYLDKSQNNKSEIKFIRRANKQ